MGSMLVVPFGRRRLLGVVVDVAEESDLPLERLAEPIAALEADVPQSLVGLGLWVAREYVSTPARGLALVLPPGNRHRRGTAAAAQAFAARRDHAEPARRRWPTAPGWGRASVPLSRRSRRRRWAPPPWRAAPAAPTPPCAASSAAA